MGWDASSDMYNYRKQEFVDKVIGLAFVNASKEVVKTAKFVDSGLAFGDLNCKDSRNMLKKAIPEHNFFEDLKVQDVIEMEENWDFKYSEEESWAYWSARKFIEVCKKHNLSIRFSY